MTEQQTEQQPAKDSLGKAMKRSEKVFLGLLIFAVATGLFIRFVPVSFLGVDVVALSPGSAPTTIEKINIEGTQTYAPDGEIKFTDIPIINQSVLEKHPWNEDPSLTDLTELDDWVKEFVTNY